MKMKMGRAGLTHTQLHHKSSEKLSFVEFRPKTNSNIFFPCRHSSHAHVRCMCVCVSEIQKGGRERERKKEKCAAWIIFELPP